MNEEPRKPSRIQRRNRRKILDAALDVFSTHGYRGSTLDQIAEAAGLSKPNILYYFTGKEEIHVILLNRLMETWLDPLVAMDPEGEIDGNLRRAMRLLDEAGWSVDDQGVRRNAEGEPLEELLRYVHRKVEMARELPRESRLFANEILQGAPRMAPHLESGLKPLFVEKCALIQSWIDAGKLAPVDPRHLIFSIWATTQHYADFDAQVQVLLDRPDFDGAHDYLRTMYRKLLAPVR